MSTSRDINYKGKHIRITAAKNGPKYVGSFEILVDPVITDTGPDSTTEEGALDNAERVARERVDKIR
jgi:hypothetical protein